MSENSISEGFVNVFPDKRDRGDPLPLTPDTYLSEEVYMRMDSIATATYPNELAPPSGVQNPPQSQVYRKDTEYTDDSQRYNPQTSSPVKSPGEYRPLPNEGDGFRTQSYSQRDVAPSYPEPYPGNPHFPPHPHIPPIPPDLNPLDPFYPPSPDNKYPPEPFYPPFPDNSVSTGYHSQNPYDRGTDPNSYCAKGARDRIPNDQYGRDHYTNSMYSTASNPNDAYGTAPDPGNRYGRPSDSGNIPYSRQQGTNIPCARDTPNNPYSGDSNLGNAYEKQLEPNDPYARTPNPDGKKPAPAFGGDPYPQNYLQQTDLSNAYGRDSNFNNSYYRDPDPQYGQCREPDPQHGQVREPDPQYAQVRKSDPQYGQVRVPDPQYGQGRDPQYGQGREPDPQYGQVRVPDPQYGQGREPDPQYGQGREPDPQYGQGREPDPQHGQGRDPQYGQGREPDPQYGQVRVPDPQYGQCREPDPQYGQVKEPDPQYAQVRVPDPQYGQGRDPQYAQVKVPDPQYGQGREPDPQHGQGRDPQYGQGRDPQYGQVRVPDPQYGQVRVPDPQYGQVRGPDPQYGQVSDRKLSTANSAPHQSSFDSQDPTPQTRFDAPRFNIRLPKPNELPAPNFPGAELLPPPNHRFQSNSLPSPHFAPQPSTPRFPPDPYPHTGYNPRPVAPYGGGYTQHEAHTIPQPRQTFSEVRNTGYSEFRDMGSEPYGAGYNLPRPHLNHPTNLPAPNIKRNPVTNTQSSRDSYYQGQSPAHPYNHPNPQFQSRIYEAVGDDPYSPASGHAMCDPNGLPTPRRQGEEREVDISPSAMPKPKIPPVNKQRSRPVHNGQRSKRDARFDVNQGLEVLRIDPEPPVCVATPPPPGWVCPACTYRNKPPRPGCEICAASRPDEYVVPVEYELDEDERVGQKRAEEHEIRVQEERLLEREMNYQAMIQAADQDLIEVDEIFECAICIMDTDVGDGVRLRECLHAFCRDCLSQHIIHAEDAEVKCPFQGETYQCQSVVTEREVKQLLSADQYRHWQQMGLNQAEGTIENAFHCKSADCTGWCVYEDEVNFFNCPVCNIQNCLTCKAIHEGKNCKEYQADIVYKAKNDDDAKRTQKMLEDMIKEGEAMKCPKCDVIIQKKLGCDWIRCTVCKTEICWATKGFRWGPKGKGDTSGGCKCRADGRTPCCPECHNCH